MGGSEIADRPLPDFENPPVTETALSVEFKPVAGWTGADFGLFWHDIKPDYPKTEVQAPIASAVERFGQERWVEQRVQVEIVTGEPMLRYWFKNEAEGKLLQLQKDRLIHNWQRTENRTYPRYPQTRGMFADAWTRYLAFLDQRGFDHPTVTQAEVTYVNHIERGDGWDVPGDAVQVTPLIGRLNGVFLPSPEVLAVEARYVIPPNRGRLRVALQPALRIKDQKEVLQLQLTARGSPKSSETEAILEWFDLGHEWVVRGFFDVTSPAMHARWGLKS